MNNLITNTYTNTYANARSTSQYITDEQGNMYEVVDKNDNSSLDKNAFLNILLTQMQLQDPLSPMDSTESINQMATFSILEQLTQITEKLDSLGQILIEMNNASNNMSEDNNNSNENSPETASLIDNSNNLLSKLQTVYS